MYPWSAYKCFTLSNQVRMASPLHCVCRSYTACWWHLGMKCESSSAHTSRVNKLMQATRETLAPDGRIKPRQ